MILKLMTDAPAGEPNWLWLDNIAEVQSFGIVESGRATCAFNNLVELREAVDRMWGAERSFDREIWPAFEPGHEPFVVRCVRAETRDRKAILALLHREAYLVDNSGKTIDRLYP